MSGSTRVILPRRRLPRFCRFCFDRRQRSECPWSNVVTQLARFVRLGHPIPCQFLIEKPLILRDERGFGCVKCPRRTDIIIKGGKLLVGPTDEIVVLMANSTLRYPRSRLTSFVNGLKAIMVVAAMVLCCGVLPYTVKLWAFTRITDNQTKIYIYIDSNGSRYCLLVNPCSGLFKFHVIWAGLTRSSTILPK